MPMFTADFTQSNEIAFLSLNFHNQNNAEIYVMAVSPQFHGRGVGSALIKFAENHAIQKGIQF